MVRRICKRLAAIQGKQRPALLTTALLALLCFLPSVAAAQLPITADDQFEFAESYFNRGEFFRAIGEYQRFICFFPQDPRTAQAHFNTGLSYFKGERFRAAIPAFKRLLEHPDSPWAAQAHLMISECHVKLKQIGAAILNLNNLIALSEDVRIRDEAHYRIGWIHLETSAWEKARSAFQKISPANQTQYRLKQLSTELAQQTRIPQKSPPLAGMLSVIPGAGFLYCQRYQDALIAFLLNGGLILAAYEAFDNGNEALGGVITFVETGFYAGNIYGAISSAHKYNRAQTTRFIENLKQNTKISFTSGYDRKGLGLAFKYPF